MDIELAIDVMEMAQYLDHIVLFSGDGDFRRLVEAVQRKGVRVTVVSTIRSQPPMIADELRRQADMFIELQDLAPRSCASITARTASAAGDARATARRDARRADARLPALPAPCRFPRGAARRSSRLVQRAGAVLRRRAARLLIVGLAPGLQRRQPHRPALHRRLCRRSALPDAAEIRLRRGRYASAPMTG